MHTLGSRYSCKGSSPPYKAC
uniref:Uncharacterized protein n=1 Tax=Anguilla anguilla TaxID=7936 RepID=A0A0E9PF64_ANGAN